MISSNQNAAVARRRLVFPAAPRLTPADRVVFVLLVGVIATFRDGYVFGLVNHVEHLPPIQHLADPRLYVNDWHVQQSIGPGPRFFYYHGVAFLSHYVSLPLLFLIGTLAANVATIALSFFMARQMFKADGPAMMGCILIGAVHSIDLGGATFLIWNYFIQATPAQPPAMLALWFAFRREPWRATASGAAAALIHPVIGLETGGIALGVIALQSMLAAYRNEMPAERRKALRDAIASVAGAGVLIALAYVLYLGRMERTLPNDAFFEILVYFRNPHHYVPSLMGLEMHGYFLAFLVSALLSWAWWRRDESTDVPMADCVGIAILFVLVLMGIGYVFVELIPLRIVASMQLYRNVYIIKWLGLLLFGGTLFTWLQEGGIRRAQGIAMLAGSGAAHPIPVLAAHLSEIIRRITSPKCSPARGSVLLLFLFFSVVLAFYLGMDGRELVFLGVLLVVGLGFVFRPGGWPGWAAPLTTTAILLAVFAAFSPASLGVFTLREGGESLDSVAFYARRHVPPDAVVLTPPTGGRFRVVSGRAIVIDFKAFVFQDSSIAEWMQRLTDVYGPPTLSGFPAAAELDRRYHTISDPGLARIAAKYGADYAVLYRDTPTRFPVIYHDDVYKLVRMNNGDAINNTE